ncbi:adenylyl-sulfate kinase [Microbacterium halotolerans]|uniref:adenylyl-sulfate kinase n=1 Tax=Microbacterium halotolerans TaxID=246613 RepID=UPI001F091AC2|nr:adenylyl-sulfate kinase [Microbacterium halotolerans]
MTDVHATLSSAQLRDVELALAGANGGCARLRLRDVEMVQGETIVLHDAEGTDVAQLRADDVAVVAPHPAEVAQIGAGTAPDLPGETLVSGAVSARRSLGHRDRTDLRVTAGFARVPLAMLITGTVPEPEDAGWDDADPVIVLDRDDTSALASAIARVEAAGRRVVVMPSPSDPASARDIAEQLVADRVDVWETAIPASPGCAILLTGLSGSGKSTISKLLVERLAETDERTTTLLDGDEVRLILSKGLGFSREDRMLNVQRIGWVASLIARHGGIAVCAPIAPYEAMRREMRERVEQHGRLLLVHVSTPLSVCAERDRKGLYAKAAAGEIAEFTGISDPYQIPSDADLTIDASVVAPGDAVTQILEAMRP